MKKAASLKKLPFADNSDKNMKVSIAESEQEKLRIYRLRYQVYVEEMGRQLPSADHKNRLVFDELDKKSFHVYAQAGSEIVSTVRVTIGTAEEFAPELFRMFCMDRFQTFCNKQQKQKLCFTSKYIVAPAYRRSSAAYMVLAWSYELWRDRGDIQFNFAGCNPYMLPLYERMGFCRFTDNFYIPEYGCMVPMVWVTEDESHMRAVGSPLCRNARKYRNNPAAADWFAKEFPAASGYVNSRLVSEDELWLILKKKFGKSPLRAVPVLKGLTEQEAKKFVHIGIIHMYKKSERIIAPGYFCHELNILLSGILEVSSPAINNPLDTTRVKPGDFCGRAALLEAKQQLIHAVAVTEVELLIISGMAFEAFRRSHPVIAHKVMRNIGSGTDIADETRRPTAR